MLRVTSELFIGEMWGAGFCRAVPGVAEVLIGELELPPVVDELTEFEVGIAIPKSSKAFFFRAPLICELYKNSELLKEFLAICNTINFRPQENWVTCRKDWKVGKRISRSRNMHGLHGP